MERLKHRSLDIGGVQMAFIDMFSLAKNQSRADIVVEVMEHYTALSRELHQRKDLDAQLGLAVIAASEEVLGNEDFILLWRGQVPSNKVSSNFGVRGQIASPFLDEWQRNGGQEDLQAAFTRALYLYVVDNQPVL